MAKKQYESTQVQVGQVIMSADFVHGKNALAGLAIEITAEAGDRDDESRGRALFLVYKADMGCVYHHFHKSDCTMFCQVWELMANRLNDDGSPHNPPEIIMFVQPFFRQRKVKVVGKKEVTTSITHGELEMYEEKEEEK